MADTTATPRGARVPEDRAPTPTPPLARALLLAGALASLTPLVGPALALGAGAAIGLTVGAPFGDRARRLSGQLLRVAVVGLGAGLPLRSVVTTGSAGFVVTAAGIVTALTAGALLGRALRVDRDTSTLISGGTAICGGSAIAAMSPALGAGAAATSVAMSTVFLLNGVALYLFPPIGRALELTQHQFGVWSAIAIHDTSSVVGAAAAYGDEALAVATVLKLTRALWIIPLVAGIALLRRRRSVEPGEQRTDRAPLPWFIALFLAASGLRLLLPSAVPVLDLVETGARALLVLALFLVGAGLTRATLAAVGLRPLLLGVTLWLLVGAGSLTAVVAFPSLVG
jgi:uncharacterized integral membrane protein (TIGR00698 family)